MSGLAINNKTREFITRLKGEARVGKEFFVSGVHQAVNLRAALIKMGYIARSKCMSAVYNPNSTFVVTVEGGLYNGILETEIKPKEEPVGHVDAKYTENLNQLIREGYVFRNITRRKLNALAQSIRNRGYSTNQTMLGPDLYDLTVGPKKWESKIKANGRGTAHGVSFTAKTPTTVTKAPVATITGKGSSLTMLIEFPQEILEQIKAAAVEKLAAEMREGVRETLAAITQALGATFGVK